MTKSNSPRYHGIANGYRSGLEERICKELDLLGVSYTYEEIKIPYVPPQQERKYTPDIVLSNGLIIELKGRFVTADRQKHRFIKEQYPDLDIRFVFQNPAAKINKGSKTTYGDWCDRYGFLYHKNHIPTEWLEEKPNKYNLKFMKELSNRR
jgi:hypothetical protein